MATLHLPLGKFVAFSSFPAVPILVVVGYYAGAPWIVPAIVFIVIPVVDYLIGPDATESLSASVTRSAVKWLRVVPRLYVFLWLPVLAWAAHTVAHTAQGLEVVWLVVSAAVATAFSTCAAHELLHWPSKFDFGLSRLIMATVAYGPFTLEHLHHHAHVGVRREGTTPPVGQSVWRFVFENYVFTLRCAWRLERRRQLAKHRSIIGNRFIQQWLLTSAIGALFFAIGGAWGMVLFAAQAAFGIFTTDYVNYAQHYGLSRPPGTPSRPDLSWNSNYFLTNALTLNITRHVHHHEDATVPYYDLKYIDDMPLLPAGYLGLFFPALVPPLWRRLMDARASRFAHQAAASA